MSEMVERVTRALHKHDADKPRPFDTLGYRKIMYGDGLAVWEHLAAPAKDIFRDQACTAIEAMREPTRNMVNAGDIDLSVDFDEECRALGEYDARRAYAAMIDEALK